MTPPLWHEGALDALAWDGRSPVVWRVPHGGGDATARRAARRAFARALLSRLSGKPVGTVEIGRDPHGAPLVASPGGWHLGFAARGAHSLIGAARRPIAVDRELDDGGAPLWDMLTPAETAELQALPEPLRPRAWLRRWTLKETHAKLIGQPRRIAPEAIETWAIDGTRAGARFEGESLSWTREEGAAIETVALWAGYRQARGSPLWRRPR